MIQQVFDLFKRGADIALKNLLPLQSQEEENKMAKGGLVMELLLVCLFFSAHVSTPMSHSEWCLLLFERPHD